VRYCRTAVNAALIESEREYQSTIEERVYATQLEIEKTKNNIMLNKQREIEMKTRSAHELKEMLRSSSELSMHESIADTKYKAHILSGESLVRPKLLKPITSTMVRYISLEILAL
jgi:hypothetical protein